MMEDPMASGPHMRKKSITITANLPYLKQRLIVVCYSQKEYQIQSERCVLVDTRIGGSFETGMVLLPPPALPTLGARAVLALDDDQDN
jgi:hypothetical protein